MEKRPKEQFDQNITSLTEEQREKRIDELESEKRLLLYEMKEWASTDSRYTYYLTLVEQHDQKIDRMKKGLPENGTN